MAITTEELETLAGQWVAEDRDGRVIAHSNTLPELERVLIEENRFPENALPAIRRVPEDGQTAFIL